MIIAQLKFDNPIIEAHLYNCEENNAFINRVYQAAKENNKKVFIIFHAGKSETETINARRLAYVRDFLQIDKYWNTMNVIYARGEKSSRDAVIEFYVGGDLTFATVSQKNRTPCLDCCGGIYYTPQNLLKPIDFKKKKTKEFKGN